MKKTNPKYYPQIAKWKKENLRQIGVSARKEFVEEYKNACMQLGIKQTEPLKKAMKDTIKLAERRK